VASLWLDFSQAEAKHMTSESSPGMSVPPQEPDLSIQRIQQYVWARYVEFKTAPFQLDEARALAFLEDHYQRHPIGQDSECFYYGILAYERSFAASASSHTLLATARLAFEAYREQTGPDFKWDPVEDRLTDLNELLAASPPA
jgi:hypothetical protein